VRELSAEDREPGRGGDGRASEEVGRLGGGDPFGAGLALRFGAVLVLVLRAAARRGAGAALRPLAVFLLDRASRARRCFANPVASCGRSRRQK